MLECQQPTSLDSNFRRKISKIIEISNIPKTPPQEQCAKWGGERREVSRNGLARPNLFRLWKGICGPNPMYHPFISLSKTAIVPSQNISICNYLGLFSACSQNNQNSNWIKAKITKHEIIPKRFVHIFPHRKVFIMLSCDC